MGTAEIGRLSPKNRYSALLPLGMALLLLLLSAATRDCRRRRGVSVSHQP